MNGESWDAVVVGGGFYGTCIATYLAEQRGFQRVLLLEQAPRLLQRASYRNQARVHGGYHYPRSFTTGYRSRANLPRFVKAWGTAVQRDFVCLYAVARRNSRVTAQQFARFCREIGAPLRPASAAHRALFHPARVESVFEAEEYVFDASALEGAALEALGRAGVRVELGASALSVTRSAQHGLFVLAALPGRLEARFGTRRVFNCTYSALNQLGGEFPRTRAQLKHELTEMALVELPGPLRNLGITLMDGPFFSVMPFPALGQHTLSHVRYTPHVAWQDAAGNAPGVRLGGSPPASRGDRMLRDAARYLPSMAEAHQSGSLFEVKTVLARNELDDGRPILFERHAELPGSYSVLGGKIDNVFDVMEKLDHEPLDPARLEGSPP